MTNSKNTKRALLSSTLALLMCVTMLIGTTFAWFTDTAQTSVNRIQSGKLDVDIVDEAGNSLDGRTLSFKNIDGSADILWEPGCRYSLEKFKVVNKGNLALKYSIQITGISGSEKLNEVIDWTFDGLADGTGELLPNAESDFITISGKMDENAGNDYQDLTIDNIAITVFATQLSSEKDSIDNTYDAATPLTSYWDGKSSVMPAEVNGVYTVKNAAEFVGIMDYSQHVNSSFLSKTIVLENDIDFGGRTVKGVGSDQGNFAGTFDGKGHTVSNFKIDNNREWYAGLFNQVSHGGNIKDLKVENATVTGGKMAGVIASNLDSGAIDNCHVKNCTVVATVKKAGSITGYTSNGTVTDCTAENVNVYCAEVDVDESGEIIGYKKADTVDTGNIATNVNVFRGTRLVSSATELANVLANIGLGSTGTVVLMKDIDVNNAWATAVVMNRSLTLDGNGHTIKNLNKPLLNLYGGTFKISNLTVEKSVVTANENQLGAGVIAEKAEWANLYMDNCHVKNCSLTGTDTRAAALVGYWLGGGEIKNSTVDHFTAFAKGSVAGIVGHRAAQSGYVADAKITNCTVTNSNISAKDDGWRIGIAIGTVAGSGTVTANDMIITNFTQSANTLAQTKKDSTAAETNPNHPLYGRISGGVLTIDGIVQ